VTSTGRATSPPLLHRFETPYSARRPLPQDGVDARYWGVDRRRPWSSRIFIITSSGEWRALVEGGHQGGEALPVSFAVGAMVVMYEARPSVLGCSFIAPAIRPYQCRTFLWSRCVMGVAYPAALLLSTGDLAFGWVDAASSNFCLVSAGLSSWCTPRGRQPKPH